MTAAVNFESRADEPAVNDREFDFTQRDFQRICALIHTRAGIALSESKRDMVYSRLARQLRVQRLDSFKTYLDRLEAQGSADDWQAFTNALTTNLTAFFREAHHFEHLTELLAKRPAGRKATIWCAAASTGEEPYSLAIAACEAYGSLHPPVTILATDIDTNVLETAARGVYPMERIEKLSEARCRRYFRKGSAGNAGWCKVVDELRQMIHYKPLNLLDSRYPMKGPFDAIFCRNVMIYFDKPTQYGVLSRMAPLLADDGFLYAGHSESFFHAADLIESCGRTIYKRPGQ